MEVRQMSQKPWIAAYVVCLLAFLVADATWISLVAIHQFQERLGDMLRPAPRIDAAVAFYLIYVAGLVILAVRPAIIAGSWLTAATHGALLGLCSYATFDLTNLAIIDRWSTGLAMTDMAWGTLLSAAVATIGYFVARRKWTNERG
jgi:uncharacterized membrane protein